MRRVFYSIIVLLFVMGISSVAFSTTKELEPVYTFNRVSDFTAIGISMPDISNPYNRIQNIMDFRFQDNETINRIYSTKEPEGTSQTPGKYTFEFNIRYRSVLLRQLNEPFILGSFTFTREENNATSIYEGLVYGRLINVNNHGFTELGLPDDTLVIMLDCEAPEHAFYINFFLSTPNTVLATVLYPNHTNNNKTDFDSNDGFSDHFEHENSPHLPTPSATVDLAAGTGIATAGIFLINFLTNSSVFGSASFNGSFNPNSAPTQNPASSIQINISKNTNTNLKTVGTGVSGLSNFFNNFGKFFKNLFEILRDMISDEGRSYANGKLTDLLSDTDLSDMSDK